MQGIFALLMGGMIVFNSALIVFFLGKAYVIPQYFPTYQDFDFGESVILVVLFFFLMIVFFGNRLTKIRKKPLNIPKKTTEQKATYGEKTNS